MNPCGQFFSSSIVNLLYLWQRGKDRVMSLASFMVFGILLRRKGVYTPWGKVVSMYTKTFSTLRSAVCGALHRMIFRKEQTACPVRVLSMVEMPLLPNQPSFLRLRPLSRWPWSLLSLQPFPLVSPLPVLVVPCPPPVPATGYPDP